MREPSQPVVVPRREDPCLHYNMWCPIALETEYVSLLRISGFRRPAMRSKGTECVHYFLERLLENASQSQMRTVRFRHYTSLWVGPTAL